MPWAAADDGEGFGREERNRVEGAVKIEEGCRHCLILSLFSSHMAGDASEEVEEVEGDGGWTWGEGEGLVGAEGTAVRGEGEGVDVGGKCCVSSSVLASWSLQGTVMGGVEREGGRGDTGIGTDGSESWDGGGDEEEGGRECRRTQGVVDLISGLLERGAKGLVVRGRRDEEGNDDDDEGDGDDDGDDGRRGRGWGRALVGPRVAFRFTLVIGGSDCWTDKVWISVRTRMVWRETSAETTLGEEGGEMMEDDADAREREGERWAASDAGEGDECDEVTWVGGDGVEVESASVAGEEEVERDIGGKEGETSWREVWSTLVNDPTSQEWVRVRGRGNGESGEWVRGGPACSNSVDNWWMTKEREERASVVSMGWPHGGEDNDDVSGGPSEYNEEVIFALGS
jgi:hypothetical protein